MKKPPLKNKKANMQVISMPERMRPNLSIDEKDLSAIKNWQIGKKYKLIIDAELTSMNKEEYGDKDMRAQFRINKVKEG